MFVKYFFSNSVTIMQNVNVISFSYTELIKEPSIIHSHPHCEIIVPINNNGSLLCNNRTLEVKNNAIYIINPNVSHTELNVADTPNEYNAFKYYVVKVNDIVYNDDGFADDITVISDSTIISELKNYLKTAYATAEKDRNVLTELNLSCFYYAFLDLLKDKKHYRKENDNDKIVTDFVREFEYYVSKNYHTKIYVKEFAETHGISQNALEKKFRAETGFTPCEYINKKRLDVAKDLLQSSSYTIYQISQNCGFISPAYFTAQFKKREGLTPKELRKKALLKQ